MKHTAPISCVATHRDGLVATAGYDNRVVLWQAATRTPLARAMHDHLANQCAFSPSGRMLVSASSDYSARIWDLPALQLRSVLLGHTDDVEMAAFSPDESRVATASRDRTARIFDLQGRCLAVLQGHEDDVLSVAWSADGGELLTSSDDGTVRRWDPASGAERGRVDLGGVQTDTIVTAADGTVFAGDDLGRISVVTGAGANLRMRQVQAHEAGVKRLVFDERTRSLASISYDRTLAVWALQAGGALALQRRSAIDAAVWPRSAAFLGDRLLFGTFGAEYHSFDVAQGAWSDQGITPTGGLNAVAEHDGVAWSVGDAGIVWRGGRQHQALGSLCNFLLPCGPLLLTGGQLGLLFDAVSGAVLHQHRSPLNCGAIFRRADGLHAAIGTYTGEALLFRLTEGGGLQFEQALPLHDNAIKGLAAAGGQLFSACASGAVAFHRLADGQCQVRHARGHARIANGCVAYAGGFASIGRDMTLRLWRDGQPLQVIETPHRNSIKCITADRSGRWLLSGSYGGTLAVYDTGSGRWEATVRPTAAGISSVAPASAPGTRFLASSYDGRIHTL